MPAFTLATALFLFSCQKEVTDTNNPVIPTTPADLTTKVNAAKVSGFVTDENNAPVVGASVKVGTTATTTTDDYGYFEVRNAEVVKCRCSNGYQNRLFQRHQNLYWRWWQICLLPHQTDPQNSCRYR